jgi:transposase-like protein
MKHRKFSAEFKRRVVEDINAGRREMAQLCREHQLSPSLVRTWRKEYEAHGPAAWMPPDDGKAQWRAMEKRLAELEAALGRATLENEFLRRAFRRAGLPFPPGVSS